MNVKFKRSFMLRLSPQLTNLSGQAFTFDADGNLTSDGSHTYQWDAENRLVAIAYPGQGAKATVFAYDGLGRRIQWSSTPSGGGATVTNHIWCGLALCQARNSSNAVMRGYYAEGERTPGSPGVSYYYAPDRIGSVRRVFASASASAYDFDPYGNPLQATAPVTDYGYAGMVTNPDSGLNLTNYRPYDPVTGRFLLRDPFGEAGDPQANLFAYVGGDPVDGVDPAGLLGPWNAPVPVPSRPTPNSLPTCPPSHSGTGRPKNCPVGPAANFARGVRQFGSNVQAAGDWVVVGGAGLAELGARGLQPEIVEAGGAGVILGGAVSVVGLGLQLGAGAYLYFAGDPRPVMSTAASQAVSGYFPPALPASDPAGDLGDAAARRAYPNLPNCP